MSALKIVIKKSGQHIGLGVYLNGTEVGNIIGSRDRAGKHHSGYYLQLNNGTRYGYNGEQSKKPGAYAYADDLKRDIRGWIGQEIAAHYQSLHKTPLE